MSRRSLTTLRPLCFLLNVSLRFFYVLRLSSLKIKLLKKSIYIYTKTLQYLPRTFLIVITLHVHTLRNRNFLRWIIFLLVFFFRYLATRMSFRSLSVTFWMNDYRLCKCVLPVVDAIWNNFYKRHLSVPDQKESEEIGVEFSKQWNFVNAIGCIDSKHMRIKCPKQSETTYFNRKYFSIVFVTNCSVLIVTDLFLWMCVVRESSMTDKLILLLLYLHF